MPMESETPSGVEMLLAETFAAPQTTFIHDCDAVLYRASGYSYGKSMRGFKKFLKRRAIVSIQVLDSQIEVIKEPQADDGTCKIRVNW